MSYTVGKFAAAVIVVRERAAPPYVERGDVQVSFWWVGDGLVQLMLVRVVNVDRIMARMNSTQRLGFLFCVLKLSKGGVTLFNVVLSYPPLSQ